MHTRIEPRLQGFTLVELLVSCVILSLGLIALSQLYMSAMWTYKKAHNMSLATKCAQLELEKIQNVGFNVLSNPETMTNDLHYPLNNTTNQTKYPDQQLYDQLSNGVRFTVQSLKNYQGTGTITVEPYTPPGLSAPATNLVKVVIFIDWKGSPSAQTMVKLSTLVANQDVQLSATGGSN